MADSSNPPKVVKDPAEAYNSMSRYAQSARVIRRGLIIELAGSLSSEQQDILEFLCRAMYEHGYMHGAIDGLAEAKANI